MGLRFSLLYGDEFDIRDDILCITFLDDRREECVIVLITVFKEINIIFFFIWASIRGMLTFMHLTYWILTRGMDIILLT